MITFPLKERVYIRGCSQHIAAGLQCAADYKANYVAVYAPFDGVVYLFGDGNDEGGYWVGIHGEDGIRFEIAHLSQRLVVTGQRVIRGQMIAVSGNSGTVTTGPHAHVQIINPLGKRLDPEVYFKGASMPDEQPNSDIEGYSVIENPGGDKGFFKGNKLHAYAQKVFTTGFEQYSFIRTAKFIPAERYNKLPKGTLSAEEVLKGGKDW